MELTAERGKSMVGAAAPTGSTAASRKQRWAGLAMSGVAILFLAVDGVAKVLQLPPVVEGTATLGYPAGVVLGLGIVELGCLVAHAIPSTSVLGALLLTGYLGGAVATHVRIGDPLFSHVLFPIYVAVLIWGGLTLRDARLRALLPLRARA